MNSESEPSRAMESPMKLPENASEELDPSVRQCINTLIGMPYKSVQSLATERSLPANLKKLEMATLIALDRSGNTSQLKRVLRDVRECRQIKRQARDLHNSTTTAEADSASATAQEEDDEDDDVQEPYGDDDDEDYEPCKSKKVKLNPRPRSESMDVDDVIEVVHTAEGGVLERKVHKKLPAHRRPFGSKTSRVSKNGRVIKQRRDYCYIYPQIGLSPATSLAPSAPPPYTSVSVLRQQGVPMKPAPMTNAVFADKNNNSLPRTPQYAPIASNTVSSSQAMSTVVVGTKSWPPVSAMGSMKPKSWPQDVNATNANSKIMQGQVMGQPYPSMSHKLQKYPSVKHGNSSIGVQQQPLTQYDNQLSGSSRQNPPQAASYLQHNETGIPSKPQERGNLTRSDFGQNLMPAVENNRGSHNVNTQVLPHTLGLHHMVNPHSIQQGFHKPTMNLSSIRCPVSYPQPYPLPPHNMHHAGKFPVPPFQSVQRSNLPHQQYAMAPAQVPLIRPPHQEMMQGSQSHSFQTSSLVTGQFQLMHQQQTFSSPLYPLQPHAQQNPQMYYPYSQLAPFQMNTKFPQSSMKPVLQPTNSISTGLENIFNIRGDKLSLPSSLWPYWKPAVTQSVNSYPAPICVPSNALGQDHSQLWTGYSGAGKGQHSMNRNYPQSEGNIRQESLYEHQQKMFQEEHVRHMKLREMWEESKREELIRQQQRQLLQQQSQQDLQLHQSQPRLNSQPEVPYPGFRGQNNQLSYPLIYNYLTAAEEQLQQMDLKQQQQLLQELQQQLQQPATAANPSNSDISMQQSSGINVDVCDDLPPILNQVDMSVSGSFHKEELMSVQSVPLEEGLPMSFGTEPAISMLVDSPEVTRTRPVSFDQHAEITKPNPVEFTRLEPVMAESSSSMMSVPMKLSSSFAAHATPSQTGPVMVESPRLPTPAALPSADLSLSTIVPTSTLPNIHELVPTIFKSLDMIPAASSLISHPTSFPHSLELVSKDNSVPHKLSVSVPPSESAIAQEYEFVCTNPSTLESTSSAESVCEVTPTTFSLETSVLEQESNQSRSGPQDCLLGNYHVDKDGCLHPVQASESEYIQGDSPPVKKMKLKERHEEVKEKTQDSIPVVTEHEGDLCNQVEDVKLPEPSRNEECSPKSPGSQHELTMSKEVGMPSMQLKPQPEVELCQESTTAESKTSVSPIPIVDSCKFSEEITSVKSPVLENGRTENSVQDEFSDLMEEVTVTVQDSIEKTIETYVRVDNETNQVIAVFSNECGEMMTLSVSRDVPDCIDPLGDTSEEINLSRASTVIVSQSPEYNVSSCDVNRNAIDPCVVQDVIHKGKTPSEGTTISVSHSSLEKRISDDSTEISPSQATTVSVTHSSMEEQTSDEMLREEHPSLVTTACFSSCLEKKSSSEDSMCGDKVIKSCDSNSNETSPDVVICDAPERQQSHASVLCPGCGSISVDKSCTVCKKGTGAGVVKNPSQDKNPSRESSDRSKSSSESTLTASSISDYLSQESMFPDSQSTMPKSTSATEATSSSALTSSDEDSCTPHEADDIPPKVQEEPNKDKPEGDAASTPPDTESPPVPSPGDAKEQGEQKASEVAVVASTSGTLPRRSAGKVTPGKQPRVPVRCSPRTTSRRQDSAGATQVGKSAMKQQAKGRKPCSNAERGCLLILAPAQLSSHELVCDFTLVHCPVHACAWHGVARRMCTHARETHRSLIMSGPESSHTVSLQQVRALRHVTFLREVSRKLFVIGVHALGPAVFATIQSVASGRAERPVVASGTLELVGLDGRVHCWRGRVCAIQQDIELLHAWGNCLEIQPEVVAAFGSSLITVHAHILVIQGPSSSVVENEPASI